MLKALTIKDSKEYLRQISKPVDFNDAELNKNIEDIKEFCLTNNCFAMACVQLGIPKRIVYIKSTSPDLSTNSEQEQVLMINPTIISQRGKTEFWEACVSCMNYTALVERPYELVVEYYDKNGNKKQQTFEGFAATVISHELDHLDGIFHMDRAKKLIILPKEERPDFRKNNPYKIHSKTCKFSYPELITENNL